MQNRPKARTEDLIVERVEDELVVYDTRSQAAHALSREATAVWESCDGSVSVDDIGGRLGFEPAVVERALAELRACDLFDEGITVRNGHTRREVAAKFAAVGGAAFAAPFIFSVSIASAAGCPCTLNKPGCTTNGNRVPHSGNCTTGGTSGAKGCDCDCCSGVCYEGQANARFCVSDACVAGGMDVHSKPACSTCCSGACSGNSTTCSSGDPGSSGAAMSSSSSSLTPSSGQSSTLGPSSGTTAPGATTPGTTSPSTSTPGTTSTPSSGASSGLSSGASSSSPPGP